MKSLSQIVVLKLLLLLPLNLIGQNSKEKDIIAFLQDACKVCQQNKKNNDLLKNVDTKNINELFHQLHCHFKDKNHEAILKTSLITEQLNTPPINDSEYAHLYHFIRGSAFLKLDVFKDAILAYQNSLKYNTTDEYFKGYTWVNLAAAYKNLNQYEESLLFYKKAAKVLSNNEKYIYVYPNIASINLHLDKYDESEKIYKKVIQMQTEFRDSSKLILSYTDLANFYYNQYLDNQAIPLFKKALAIAQKMDDPEKLKNAHYNMHVVYKNLGEYKKSLDELYSYNILDDSLSKAQKVRDITSLEKEQEKQLLEEQKNNEIAIVEKNNQLLTGGILATLLILGLLTYFYTNIRHQNKIIAAKNQKIERLNSIKDELLSVLGHDLRTPMQHLISVFDRSFRVLKKGDEGKLLKLLQHGNLAVNKTSILLDNILQWVTQQNNQTYFKKEAVVLAPLIHQITANFIPIMDMRSIQLERTIPAAATVLADRNSLKIIIRNIVDNAIKFTPKNGQIRIYTTTEIADKLTIHIQDTGSGMSPEVLNKLKGITVPGKDASGRKSTGLGLGLSKDFIKRNDGTLKIESEVGKGSTFSIELPIEVLEK